MVFFLKYEKKLYGLREGISLFFFPLGSLCPDSHKFENIQLLSEVLKIDNVNFLKNSLCFS